MPTLERRKDGCHFVRHFYRRHSTWQIQGEGVRYLKRRGIKEEDHFRTDLLMELWGQGFVYYGDVPPSGPMVISLDTPASDEVRDCVREFHRSMYSADAESAWKFVEGNAQDRITFEQFKKDLIGEDQRRLVSWNIKDIILYRLPVENHEAFEGVKRVALVTVTVRIALKNHLPVQPNEREVSQVWMEVNRKWQVSWEGFKS